VIDVLILTKAEDGSVEAMQFSDVGKLGELEALDRRRPTELLDGRLAEVGCSKRAVAA
jgi:hypothetical protein